MINNTKTLKAMAEATMRLNSEITGEIAARAMRKVINDQKNLIGVRHAGDFCDGCACDDKVCETCPWAQYVPDTRK